MLGLEDARDKYRKNRTKIKWAQRALKLAGDVSHNPKVIAASMALDKAVEIGDKVAYSEGNEFGFMNSNKNMVSAFRSQEFPAISGKQSGNVFFNVAPALTNKGKDIKDNSFEIKDISRNFAGYGNGLGAEKAEFFVRASSYEKALEEAGRHFKELIHSENRIPDKENVVFRQPVCTSGNSIGEYRISVVAGNVKPPLGTENSVENVVTPISKNRMDKIYNSQNFVTPFSRSEDFYRVIMKNNLLKKGMDFKSAERDAVLKMSQRGFNTRKISAVLEKSSPSFENRKAEGFVNDILFDKKALVRSGKILQRQKEENTR